MDLFMLYLFILSQNLKTESDQSQNNQITVSLWNSGQLLEGCILSVVCLASGWTLENRQQTLVIAASECVNVFVERQIILSELKGAMRHLQHVPTCSWLSLTAPQLWFNGRRLARQPAVRVQTSSTRRNWSRSCKCSYSNYNVCCFHTPRSVTGPKGVLILLLTASSPDVCAVWADLNRMRRDLWQVERGVNVWVYGRREQEDQLCRAAGEWDPCFTFISGLSHDAVCPAVSLHPSPQRLCVLFQPRSWIIAPAPGGSEAVAGIFRRRRMMEVLIEFPGCKTASVFFRDVPKEEKGSHVFRSGKWLFQHTFASTFQSRFSELFNLLCPWMKMKRRPHWLRSDVFQAGRRQAPGFSLARWFWKSTGTMSTTVTTRRCWSTSPLSTLTRRLPERWELHRKLLLSCLLLQKKQS